MSAWIPFAEQGVELRFGDCDVIRWDEHDAYVHGLQKVETTKAVDFVVRTLDHDVVLFELKDFRGHRIPNRERLRSGVLAREVAEKVRDTLAGMTWACDREKSDAKLHRIVRAKYGLKKKLTVVLWLDRDDKGFAAEASALTDAIRSNLRPYLDAHVVVTSLALERHAPKTRWPWLEARSLPRKSPI